MYVCKEVYKSFKLTVPDSKVQVVLINNKPTVVYLPPITLHFTDINILGTEYLKVVSANLTITFDNEYIFISFDYNRKLMISQLGQIILQLEPNILGKIVGVGLLSLALFFIFKKNLLSFFWSQLYSYLMIFFIIYK